jgi:HEAT repeat protein
MAGRIVRGHFDAFAQSRLAFVRAIADVAERPEYLESLLAEDAFGTLKPMLHDKIATVQQTAALALGRMAGCSVDIAIELVKAGTPPEFLLTRAAVCWSLLTRVLLCRSADCT